MRAIVIGGSSGIGAAVAARLEKDGHQVATLQRRASTNGIVLDLRWPLEQVRAAVEAQAHELGGLDALVVAGGVGAYQRACIGYWLRGRNATEYEEQLAEILETNLRGPIYAIEAALPLLASAGKDAAMGEGLGQIAPASAFGRVLTVSSVIPRNPPADLAAYAASKAGLDVWIRAQARRWRRRGVLLNALATGWIETPMTLGIAEPKRRDIVAAIGAHRMGTVEEAAAAVEYFLVHAPSYFSGDVVPMSGGL